MPYTHFRMIAYEVPTATNDVSIPWPGGVISGWDAGQEYQAIGRLPVPNQIPVDARIRLKRLAGVVNLAWNRLQASGVDNANTLKIFILPEFYFRPPSTIGPDYTDNTYPVSVARQIFDALDTMFAHADFTDWLFLCGTVMWNTSEDKASINLHHNTAPYVKGGQANGLLGVVEKRQPSGIDGINGSAPGFDPHTKLFFESWRQRSRRVFNVDGITFGLDICLDHLDADSCRVLKNVMADWSQNSNGGNTPVVQLHLLTAGGMSINARSVVPKVGGFILRNDGLAPDVIVPPRRVSHFAQTTGYTAPDPLLGQTLPSTPHDRNSTAALVYWNPAFQSVIPTGALSVPNPGNQYNWFAQQVVFYHTNLLP